ncbi:MAG: helix-turn-helix domain-containing protein [Gammaproteobacteria bacterium]|nr:helix-turn-helix domain-containing protein [Gammaproteobacteria bacterium]
MNTRNTALEEAVQLLGGQTAVAALCAEATGQPVKQAHVWNWLNRDNKAPPEHAVIIEREVKKLGGTITREVLCPGFPWALVTEAA